MKYFSTNPRYPYWTPILDTDKDTSVMTTAVSDIHHVLSALFGASTIFDALSVLLVLLVVYCQHCRWCTVSTIGTTSCVLAALPVVYCQHCRCQFYGFR